MNEDLRNQIQNEEQQLLIGARYELRELERKEKLSDAEYLEMLQNVRSTGDEQQVQQFLDWHISVSEYENLKSKNEQVIKEINEKYGITEERELQELHVEALRLRPQLELLQSYYKRNGSNVMRNLDISVLSDTDVLREYDTLTYGMDNETINNMLNEEIRNRIVNGVSETANYNLGDDVAPVVTEHLDSSLMDLIPNDEQQLYISSRYELRELERKEKLPDTEYFEMLQNIRSTGDEQQVQQFLDWHMSVSEYEYSKSRNEQWIKEINEKYGITEERELQELHVEALRLRPQLARIKSYYANRGGSIMRNVEVADLSDSEVVTLYDRLTYKMSGERLNEIINGDVRDMVAPEIPDFEAQVSALESRTVALQSKSSLNDDDRNEINNVVEDVETVRKSLDEHKNNMSDESYANYYNRLDGVLNRLNGLSRTSGDSTLTNDEIEQMIEEFRRGSLEIKQLFDETQFKLVFGDWNNLDVSDAIRGLDSELRELNQLAKDLIAEMDAFRLQTENAEFSMSPVDIKRTIEEFKTRLYELKQTQIKKYNDRVDTLNGLIDEAQRTNSPEMTIGLEKLPRCEFTIASWTDFKYLEEINYDRLFEMADRLSKLSRIENIDLDSDISSLEGEVLWIESLISDSMSVEQINYLKEQIVHTSGNCVLFNVKVNSYKEQLSEEVYNKYLARLDDVQHSLFVLNGKLKTKEVDEKKDNEFKTLRNKLTEFGKEVTRIANLVESLYGKVLIDAINPLEDHIITLSQILEEMKNEIEEKKAYLDENQINRLMQMVAGSEALLSVVQSRLKEPDMYKELDTFAYLNGQIDGIEKAIDNLEKYINSFEAPIKNRKVRKEIDKQIKFIEAEIKFVLEQLEKHKEEDPQKYEASMERLTKLNQRFNDVCKNYRKKCPLLVMAFKSAKDWLKKHKKIALIIAGLAAIALLHATVGPVIIPAIMHGNLMIGHTAPALSGITGFVNKILGGLINATYSKGLWFLANGTRLSYGGASASLLKGLAISGLGTSSVVLAIKKLISKMKEKELKLELKEDKKEVKNEKKVLKLRKPKLEKIKLEKPEKNKNGNTKKADKMSLYELTKLFVEFRKSGKSLDAFCEENKLSETDKALMQLIEEKSRQNEEDLKKTRKRGK